MSLDEQASPAAPLRLDIKPFVNNPSNPVNTNPTNITPNTTNPKTDITTLKPKNYPILNPTKNLITTSGCQQAILANTLTLNEPIELLINSNNLLLNPILIITLNLNYPPPLIMNNYT